MQDLVRFVDDATGEVLFPHTPKAGEGPDRTKKRRAERVLHEFDTDDREALSLRDGVSLAVGLVLHRVAAVLVSVVLDDYATVGVLEPNVPPPLGPRDLQLDAAPAVAENICQMSNLKSYCAQFARYAHIARIALTYEIKDLPLLYARKIHLKSLIRVDVRASDGYRERPDNSLVYVPRDRKRQETP